MLNISFTKYHGIGNDFLLIDDRARHFPRENPTFIRKMCHRQFGVGADGLILLAADPLADFCMKIYNNDGLEAASCGNGLRCFVRFLHELGLVQSRYRIRTQERIVEAFLERERVVVDMGQPEEVVFGLQTEVGLVNCVNTGVFHAVQFVSNMGTIDVQATGALLRKRFNANVNFAAVQEDRSIRVRTFEKGVEAETLACGTGAVAVGYIASCVLGLQGPIAIHFPGGSVEVWEKGGKLFLAGPAEKVFTGTYWSHE